MSIRKILCSGSVTALLLGACGGDGNTAMTSFQPNKGAPAAGSGAAPASSPAPTTSAAGTSAAPKAGSGAAPMTGPGTTSPSTTSSTPASSGAAGSAMAAAGGSSASTAGSGMAAAGSSAGSAGSGGMAAAAGSGGDKGGPSAMGSGMGFIREDAPTQDSAKKAGKFKVEKYASGFPVMGYGAGTVYYPTDADPPFAMDVVVPGFTAYQNSIAGWGPFLASHGIVTMTIDTLTTGDLPAQRADELMAALKALEGENTREGSPLKGKLDNSRQCVSGWSMGGGGTLIAASKNPMLKCAVSFAAWQPTGGESNKVPVLMFEGTVDPLAAGMSTGFYMSTPDSVPKMLFEVNGAGHDVANDPKNSGGVIGMYGLSWFKVYLEGDDRYKQFLLLPKPSITATFETNLK